MRGFADADLRHTFVHRVDPIVMMLKS